MTGRIEHDADVVLRLAVSNPGPTGDGPVGGSGHVLDLNVEMLRRALPICFGGPSWGLPTLLELDVEHEAAGAYLCPAGVLGFSRAGGIRCDDLCAEKGGVERGQQAWRGSGHGDGRQLQRRPTRVHKIQRCHNRTHPTNVFATTARTTRQWRLLAYPSVDPLTQ